MTKRVVRPRRSDVSELSIEQRPRAAEEWHACEEAAGRRRLFEHTYGHVERGLKRSLEAAAALRKYCDDVKRAIPAADFEAQLEAALEPLPVEIATGLRAAFAGEKDYDEQLAERTLEQFELVRFCRAKNRPDVAVVIAVKLGMLIAEAAIRNRHGATWRRGVKFKGGRQPGARGQVAKAIAKLLRQKPALRAADVPAQLGWRVYEDDIVETPWKDITLGRLRNIVTETRPKKK